MHSLETLQKLNQRAVDAHQRAQPQPQPQPAPKLPQQ